MKSNDSLCIGQLKLTATVCPQRKAVYRSGGMECHDTMSRLDMEWSMPLIPTNRVSTGNAETMSAVEKLWDRRDSVREGTVKQRNVKAWKVTHFRSETESLQQLDNKNRKRCGHTRLRRKSDLSSSGGSDAEQRDENANSNRIHSSSERLDSSTAIILQKHRAWEEPSKLRAADDVERSDHAKNDGEVPVEASNASRSVKVMGVNLPVQYLVSSTKVPP